MSVTDTPTITDHEASGVEDELCVTWPEAHRAQETEDHRGEADATETADQRAADADNERLMNIERMTWP